jgi:hypothetical protein
MGRIEPFAGVPLDAERHLWETPCRAVGAAGNTDGAQEGEAAAEPKREEQTS